MATKIDGAVMVVADEDWVAEADACPACGERRVDMLRINIDRVACLTCGRAYEVGSST